MLFLSFFYVKSLSIRLYSPLLLSLVYIFKAENPVFISSYLPVYTRTHLSKLLETIVISSIHLSLNNILCEEQHRFCSICLILQLIIILFFPHVYFIILENMVDVNTHSKAFERVDHRLLIQTLYIVLVLVNLFYYYSSI